MVLSVSSHITIPNDVTVECKNRVIKVTGPRGVLVRSFAKAELDICRHGNKLTVTNWFPSGKKNALPRAICSHIENMIIGVTKGFEYKMRFAYFHFPISCVIEKNGTHVEIHNFMHELRARVINMVPGVTASISKDVKDEIILQGNSVEDVSLCAARIQQSLKIHDKDLRKFLDGCYVSAKGNVVKSD